MKTFSYYVLYSYNEHFAFLLIALCHEFRFMHWSVSVSVCAGTTERVCLIQGTVEALNGVHDFIAEKVREMPQSTQKTEPVSILQPQTTVNPDRIKQVSMTVYSVLEKILCVCVHQPCLSWREEKKGGKCFPLERQIVWVVICCLTVAEWGKKKGDTTGNLQTRGREEREEGWKNKGRRATRMKKRDIVRKRRRGKQKEKKSWQKAKRGRVRRREWNVVWGDRRDPLRQGAVCEVWKYKHVTLTLGTHHARNLNVHTNRKRGNGFLLREEVSASVLITLSLSAPSTFCEKCLNEEHRASVSIALNSCIQSISSLFTTIYNTCL